MTRGRPIEGRQTSFPFPERSKCKLEGDFVVCDDEDGTLSVSFNEKDISQEEIRRRAAMGGGSKPKIDAYRKEGIYMVHSAFVPYSLLDKGVGTKLYEALARAAHLRGSRLGSSDVRSVFSEAFWRKQKAKGRASCVGTGGVYYRYPLQDTEKLCKQGEIEPRLCKRLLALRPPSRDYWPCKRYVLNYPPPASLGKLGGRRRRRT